MKTFEEIIQDIFKIPLEEVKDGLSSKDIPDWDSMNYLLLIAELEKRFGLSFTMDEVMSAQSVGDIHAIVEKRKTIQ